MSRYIHLIFVFIMLAIVSSCESKHNENGPVTIAISPWAGYAFALLAMDLGYFKVKNIDQIKLVNYSSLTESRNAFENGNVDGMFSTMIEVIESSESGSRKPNVVLVTNFSNGPDQILAKSEISSIEDIRQKRVGVEKSSIGMYMLDRALNINDIPFNELTLAHMSVKDMEKALKNNEIDVAICYPPYSMDIKKLAPNVIFHSGLIHNEIIDLLSVDEEVIFDKPEQIKLFINGWVRAYDFYNKNPEEASRIVKKYRGFSQMDLVGDLNEISLVDYRDQSAMYVSGGVLENSFNKIMKIMNSHNLIRHEIDVSSVVNKRVIALYPDKKN